jgi:hypothetical protein
LHASAVEAFVKNAGLGFAIPYLHNGQVHDYVPDFIIRVQSQAVSHLILEIKGHDLLEEVKRAAAERWITAVNAGGKQQLVVRDSKKTGPGHRYFIPVGSIAEIIANLDGPFDGVTLGDSKFYLDGIHETSAFEPRDFPRFWEGEIGCLVLFRARGTSARRLEAKKGRSSVF